MWGGDGRVGNRGKKTFTILVRAIQKRRRKTLLTNIPRYHIGPFEDWVGKRGGSRLGLWSGEKGERNHTSETLKRRRSLLDGMVPTSVEKTKNHKQKKKTWVAGKSLSNSTNNKDREGRKKKRKKRQRDLAFVVTFGRRLGTRKTGKRGEAYLSPVQLQPSRGYNGHKLGRHFTKEEKLAAGNGWRRKEGYEVRKTGEYLKKKRKR